LTLLICHNHIINLYQNTLGTQTGKLSFHIGVHIELCIILGKCAYFKVNYGEELCY